MRMFANRIDSRVRIIGLYVVIALLPLLATLPFSMPVQAAGVVTDCSSPSGSNGFYTKLGGGGSVTFNCPFPGPTVITINNVIPAGNTIVDGTNNGHRITLSGGGTHRLFDQYPNGGTLTLQHITLRDGFANGPNGGCIYNESNVLLNRCEHDALQDHWRQKWGGAVYNYNPTSTLTLINSQIISNTAETGGALYINGTPSSAIACSAIVTPHPMAAASISTAPCLSAIASY